jgi:hypothetical protein
VLLGLTQPQLFAAAMMLIGAAIVAAPRRTGLRASRATAG